MAPELPARRRVLTAVAAGACTVAGLGVFGYWLRSNDLSSGATGPTGPSGGPSRRSSTTTRPRPKPVTELTVTSAARGRDVRLLIIRPDPVPDTELRVCLALHGRGADATMFTDLGVPAMLTAAVAAGVPPFAVVAVDGGDNYWTARTPEDDPQRMLDTELPGWLADAGLVEKPFAVLGISMGAYGALHYARTHRDQVRVAVAVSPALFASWTDAKARNVFADRATWEATEPLRHVPELAGIDLGVWCGTADPFAPVARQLVTKAKPKSAILGPGGHDDTYWRKILPDALAYLGRE